MLSGKREAHRRSAMTSLKRGRSCGACAQQRFTRLTYASSSPHVCRSGNLCREPLTSGVSKGCLLVCGRLARWAMCQRWLASIANAQPPATKAGHPPLSRGRAAARGPGSPAAHPQSQRSPPAQHGAIKDGLQVRLDLVVVPGVMTERPAGYSAATAHAAAGR